MSREVVIVSGVRTAIGTFGGSLKDFAPSDLAARVVKEAVARAKIDPNEVGHLYLGNVIHTEPKDMYISRLACVNGGLPHGTAALTVNRLCGSGMQAIVSAAQSILLGDTDAAVGGGAESMSRGGYLVPSARCPMASTARTAVTARRTPASTRRSPRRGGAPITR